MRLRRTGAHRKSPRADRPFDASCKIVDPNDDDALRGLNPRHDARLVDRDRDVHPDVRFAIGARRRIRRELPIPWFVAKSADVVVEAHPVRSAFGLGLALYYRADHVSR